MKRIALITIFMFSIVLNLAVAASVGWHFFAAKHSALEIPATDNRLTEDDFKIIGRCCMQSGGPKIMMDLRQKIVGKKAEVLDLLAKSPGDPRVASNKLDELNSLTGEMEKQAATRISQVIASLPPEKREAFLIFLKNRMAMGFGPGMSRGGACRCCGHSQTEAAQK